MEDALEIPVRYKNEERSYKAHVVRVGYVNHIIVEIEGTQVTIERDEEGNYRALIDVEKLQDYKIDKHLLEAIVEVLQKI